MLLNTLPTPIRETPLPFSKQARLSVRGVRFRSACSVRRKGIIPFGALQSWGPPPSGARLQGPPWVATERWSLRTTKAPAKTITAYLCPCLKTDNLSYADFREFIETRPAEVVANILISLIHQANYLLDQQLLRLEKDFLEQGGLR